MTSGLVVKSKAKIEQFQDRSSYLVASLEIEMFRARRYGRPLSLISLSVLEARSSNIEATGALRVNVEKRLREIGPVVLRMPDFWGRVDRIGFLIVLPETPLAGAEAAIGRMTASEPFERLLAEEKKRTRLALGCATMSDAIDSFDSFAAAATANIIWRSPDARSLVELHRAGG